MLRRKKMKVFISWSGDLSLQIALIFRDWIPSVVQSIEPYVSSEDIDKGARWSTDIAKELENSTFGILCVTKSNLEAPWLSFEAGALSKTMEKSFVTPFLFDIKRSEVQGPILQFQSTIFQKEDIRRMMKTLNNACGESGISEKQLDKAFEVWYPSLEESLNKLKTDIEPVNDNKKGKKEIQSSEILEEILELSRNNQKLLKSPDLNLINLIEEIKKNIDETNSRNLILRDKNRISKKYNIMFFEDLVHKSFDIKDMPYRFLITLSFFKEDFPWVYDMGKELLEMLKKEKSTNKKIDAINAFQNMIDFIINHPLLSEMYERDIKSMRLFKEMPFILMDSIEDLKRIYL